MAARVSQRISENPLLSEIPEEESLGNPCSLGIAECKIIRDDFGYYRESNAEEGKVVYRFTLLNKDVTVQVLTYGATLAAVTMPDKRGVIDDVVMGFDTLEDYRNPRNPYFGGTLGRITGIIPNCTFTIEDEKYFVSNNFFNCHHANGGFVGFDKVLWNSYVADDKLYLTYMSEDNEEGFPGDVLATRSYELTNNNELIIETTAKCSKSTPIDITTHVDFNLCGHGSGPGELYKHFLMVNADKYAQVDDNYIMTGKLKKVSRTVLDFRIPRPIGRMIHKVPGGGFDQFMNLTRGTHKSITFAAKLIHPDSGRYVEVMSDQPGLLIYSQNNLFAPKELVSGHPISCWVNDPTFLLEQQKIYDDESEGMDEQENELEEEHTVEDEGFSKTFKSEFNPLIGKKEAQYLRHGAIRLVPMNFPEPIARRQNYVNYIINPGETYLNTTIFKFGTKYEKFINLSEIVPESFMEGEIPEELSIV